MTEFFAIIMNNIVELVFAVIFAVITCFVTPWAKNTLAPFISEVVIPWLKERRLYSLVSKFVKGAEKYSKSHQIDKKKWVVEHLEKKGIEITPEIEAYIESAVEELDIAIESATSTLIGTLVETVEENDTPSDKHELTE